MRPRAKTNVTYETVKAAGHGELQSYCVEDAPSDPLVFKKWIIAVLEEMIGQVETENWRLLRSPLEAAPDANSVPPPQAPQESGTLAS